MKEELKTNQARLEAKREGNNTKLGVLQENSWTSQDEMKILVNAFVSILISIIFNTSQISNSIATSPYSESSKRFMDSKGHD
jgi:hypothetical protein